MTLLAAFQVLLYRYSRQGDVVVGTPVAGRSRGETEGVIGFFVNMLVLRTELSGRLNFGELLQRVRETALGALFNQDLPFEKLVEEMEPERELNRTPLFQVLFTLQNMPEIRWQLPGLRLEQETVVMRKVKYDFSLTLRETESGLRGYAGYRSQLLEQNAVMRSIGHLERLLEAVAGRPETMLGDLELLSRAERKQIVEEWNATWREYPREQTVHGLLEEQARRTPQAVAVVLENSSSATRN